MSADDVRLVEEATRLNTWATAARAAVDPDYAREIMRRFHPQLEFRSRVTAVEARVYVGHEGIQRYWADMLDAFEAWGWVNLSCRSLYDGRVLVTGEFDARGRESGVPLHFEIATLWSLEEGLIRRIETFTSEQAARRAAGL